MPPVRNLVGHWKLDGNGKDETGNSDLSLTSAETGLATLVSGEKSPKHSSIGFNGKTSFSSAVDVPAWRVPTYAFAIRFQLDRLPAEGEAWSLIAKDTASLRPPNGFIGEVRTSGGITGLRAYNRTDAGGVNSALFFAASGDSTDGSVVGRISAGVAYLAVFAFDGTNGRIWLDKTLLATCPIAASGLSNNTGKLFVMSYDAGAGFANGVADEVMFWSGTFTQHDVDALADATTISHSDPASGTGIQLPRMGFQTITDAVPAGAVWWDPRRPDDSGDGKAKATAKKTFAAAEALASTSRRIILAGTAGQTVYHAVPQITPTKSGANSGARMELFAEPGCTVVLVMQSEFLGGLDQSWTWSTKVAAKGIYETVGLSLPDGVSSITEGETAKFSNCVYGMLELPGGPLGQTYFMQLAPVGLTEFADTGGGRPGSQRGYGGPSLCFPGNGQVRVRLQPPSVAVAGNEWPTDGIMGSLIGSDGSWQKPDQPPGSYKIHIVRWGGDYGDPSSDLFRFDTNGVDWWHLKGINCALCIGWARLGGNTGIWFDQCTRFCHGRDTAVASLCDQIVDDHSQMITGDWRQHAWRAYKTAGYWPQHSRKAQLYAETFFSGTANFDFNDCIIYGWFDNNYLATTGGKPKFVLTYRHCAFINIVDDGMSQDGIGGQMELEWDHCFSFGGPPFSGGGGDPGAGTEHIYVHHCVIDVRLPILWLPYGDTEQGKVNGISPHHMWPHQQDGWRPMKFYQNTVIAAGFGEKGVGYGIGIVPGGNRGLDVPSDWQHEVYSNILVIYGSRPYRTPNTTGKRDWTNGASLGDFIVNKLSCLHSAAGTQRYDHNVYSRLITWTPHSPAFLAIQDSNNKNNSNYSSLADFKANVFSGGSGGHFARSASMYAAGTGGVFAGDGTAGHEQHGLEVDPGFVDVAALDYRPTHPRVITGAKNLSAAAGTWPGTGNDGYRGALDPSGDGSEVGPRPLRMTR